jgi:hypothetical protein
MQTKIDELSHILEGKTIFYVNIEAPNSQNFIDETSMEMQENLRYRIEGIDIAKTTIIRIAATKLELIF